MKADIINLVPQSGGKDSQASMLMAVHGSAQNIQTIFADTGIEHELTYQHLSYLEEVYDQKINRVKANFDQKIAQKRVYIDQIWRSEGVNSKICDDALSVLNPTGIPFLDLCLWKGRFPGHASAEFCSIELKQKPMQDFQDYLFRNVTKNLTIWQGTRREESRRRKQLTPWDAELGDVLERTGFLIHRPIVYWKESEVFEFCKNYGVKVNPLYSKGFNRVGCMPCKNERKQGIKTMAARYPDYVERVAEFERLVSLVSKQGVSTFLMAAWPLIY